MFGPTSETLSDLQLELLAEDEPGVTVDEVEAEAAREPYDESAGAGTQAASRTAALA